MKKAFFGGLAGLLIGGVVWLYFGYVSGQISLRLFPPGIESFDLTPQATALLIQCVFTGIVTGSITSFFGRLGLGLAAGILAGYSLGFIFMGHEDPPWDFLGALWTLLPVVFASGLSCTATSLFRMKRMVSSR